LIDFPFANIRPEDMTVAVFSNIASILQILHPVTCFIFPRLQVQRWKSICHFSVIERLKGLPKEGYFFEAFKLDWTSGYLYYCRWRLFRGIEKVKSVDTLIILYYILTHPHINKRERQDCQNIIIIFSLDIELNSFRNLLLM
jgi:hypothetical protein